jgi:hypothetical protein
MEVSGQHYALANVFGSPQYLLDGRLNGFQSWSDCCGKEKNPALAGNRKNHNHLTLSWSLY